MKIFIIYLNRWPLGQIIYLGIFDKDIQAQIFLSLHEKKKKNDGMLSYYYSNYGENNKRCLNWFWESCKVVRSMHFENHLKY